MNGYILVFSVCSRLVSNRREMISYLQKVSPGSRVIAIELSDALFTLSIYCPIYESRLIESRLSKKGFHVTLLAIHREM